MNWFDIAIIIMLLMGLIIGFKRGAIYQTVVFLGFFVIIILSFKLKNPVSAFMYNNLPFFKFGGVFVGVSVLNIILYEIIAFFIVLFVLSLIFKILLKISSIIEKLLKATIILGIPSKLLGAIVGLLESFVIVFVIVFIFSLPVFNLNFIKESKYADKILNNTPFLSGMTEDMVIVFDDIISIKDDYTDKKQGFNQEALNTLVRNKIITKESALNLYNAGKINVKPSE